MRILHSIHNASTMHPFQQSSFTNTVMEEPIDSLSQNAHTLNSIFHALSLSL
eukprot:c18_g1_i1 orf=2-154(-)